MTPALRVLAGADPSSMQDITSLVNTGSAHPISSDAFKGEVAMYIKDFPGNRESSQVAADAYFKSAERTGVTWSIQTRGRFLQPRDADTILFGNTFERSLNLPWGSGAALKLMSYIDPTLEQDLGSKTRPWALSPLAATMPHLSVTKAGPETAFPGVEPLDESASILSGEQGVFKDANARRTHFRQKDARKATTFGPEDVVTTDFCYGYLSFHPSLALKLPGGVSIDLQRHWDGQQVRFVCCERGPGSDGQPWGDVLWCVAIEPVNPEAVASATV